MTPEQMARKRKLEAGVRQVEEARKVGIHRDRNLRNIERARERLRTARNKQPG